MHSEFVYWSAQCLHIIAKALITCTYVCTLSSHFGLRGVSLTVPQVPHLCHNSHTYTSYCSCVCSSHTVLTMSQETMCNKSFLPCLCSIELAQLCTWHHLYNYIAPFYRGSVHMNILSPVANEMERFWVWKQHHNSHCWFLSWAVVLKRWSSQPLLSETQWHDRSRTPHL